MQPSQKSTLLVINENNLNEFEKISSDSFVNLNIWERNHIQEWIRKAPEILGEDLLTLSIEFDKFTNSSDRLDILALDKKGNLLVIELKRDEFAGYADLQAIRYASMISSMTLEKLLPYYIAYQRKNYPEQEIDYAIARETIKEFVDNQEFTDFSTRPRIILCSENFSSELTTSVLWLNQFGLDISCVRIRPHRIDGKIIVVPTVIIPIPEAKQYQTDIQQKEEAIQIDKSRTKRPTTIKILLDNGKIKTGDTIILHDNLPDYVQRELQNPPSDCFKAVITGKLGQQNTVLWLDDNKEYSISNLTHQVFSRFHPEKQYPSSLAGGWYWQTEEGKNLYLWADEVWNETNNA
jgi:hypothetical protein